jgi:hypothetical protein
MACNAIECHCCPDLCTGFVCKIATPGSEFSFRV